jgi:uncharacterized membrane protein
LIEKRSIPLIASFAALYFILSMLPDIPVIGFPGITIKLEASAASIFGAILGPHAGPLAALIGVVVAFFYGGARSFDLPFILCPALNALVVGLIFKNRSKIAFALFAMVIAAFWFTPVVYPVFDHWYVGLAATFDKIMALFLIVPVTRMLKTRSVSSEKAELRPSGESFTLLLVASFIGNQADSALGSTIFAIPLVYEMVFGLRLDMVRWLFIVSPFAYPIIRLLQALIAASIGLPLIRALRVRGWV